MSGRGLHIALTDAELAQLEALPSDEIPDFVANDLEESKFGTPDACQTDKAWAYIHAALNGTDPDGALTLAKPVKTGLFSRFFGPKPLPDVGAAKFAIIGTRQLVDADDYFLGLVPASEVEVVSACLGLIPEGHFRDRVKAVHERFRASGSVEVAYEYALGWLPGLVEFFDTAKNAGKNVIFSVDY